MIFSIAVIGLFILSIIHKDLIYDVSLATTNQFITSVFPSIFMSFMIIDLINMSSLPQRISEFSHSFFNKIFKFNYPASSYIYIISFLVPLPTSVKLVNEAYKNDLISLKEANHILKFNKATSFTTLLTLSIIFFNSLVTQIFFILSFYLSSIIIGIIASYFYKEKNAKLTPKKCHHINKLASFNTSITKNINILLWVLGFNIFFSVIVSLLLVYLPISFYNLSIFHLLIDRSVGVDILLNSLHYTSFIIFLLLFFIPFLSIYHFVEVKMLFNEVNLLSFVFFRFLTGLLTLVLFSLFLIVI